jgi:hypothetical protein
MNEEELPACCLRGLRQSDCVKLCSGVRRVGPKAFDPDTRTKKDREDGRIETSIDWEDEPNVVLALVRMDAAATKHGIARVTLTALADIKESIGTGGVFDFERRKTDTNPYHGNLLFSTDDSGHIWMICSGLALKAELLPA